MAKVSPAPRAAPLSVRTQSPLFYIHTELLPGGRIDFPSEYPERAAYVVTGRVEADGREYGSGRMLVFAGDDPVLTAFEASTVMLLGGEPLGPRHIWWNFVSSYQDRIEQAEADWQSGRVDLPLNDDLEFFPLPEEPRPAPELMS